MRPRIRRYFSEPLVQFLLAGVLLFGADHVLHPPPRRVEISADVVAGLRADFARREGRPPSAGELDDAITRFIETEVLYREALARGLDRGDVIVRRRLVQKMELVSAAERELEAPSDAELTAFLAEHADRYRHPARFDFTQVFLSREHAARADALRTHLSNGAQANALGDPFPHGAAFHDRSAVELSTIFGAAFVEGLAALTPGEWSVVPSSLGVHLVRLASAGTTRAATLDEVRARVTADYRDARHEREKRAAIARLVDRYDVRVSGAP